MTTGTGQTATKVKEIIDALEDTRTFLVTLRDPGEFYLDKDIDVNESLPPGELELAEVLNRIDLGVNGIDRQVGKLKGVLKGLEQ